VFEEIILAGGSIDVYKSIMMFHKYFIQFISNGIDIYSSDPLNCNEDPCHLAWIFNQNLLKFVFNAVCSNGTLFKDLDSESFAECYVIIFMPNSIQ